MQQYVSQSPESTRMLAKRFSSLLAAGDVVLLQGELGAGKTEFVKGLAEGFGVTERVTSPTFTLLNIYQGSLPLYHFDLYRLDDAEELANIGFGEFLGGDGVAVIEWPDLFSSEMPDEYLKVELRQGDQSAERFLKFVAQGDRYAARLEGSDLL